MSLPSIEEKFAQSIFFVEATSYERLAIYREMHKKYTYEEDNMGLSKTIGYLNNNPDMPICVQFSFIFLEGFRICFYNATSRFVDHDMVENYIQTKYLRKYDNGTRTAMTNAMNFHHVFSAIKEQNKLNNASTTEHSIS